MKKTAILAFSASMMALTNAPAFADRHPNAGERQRIERVLTAAGYASWGEIELDRDDRRDVWEVDDARHKNGRVYDLKIDARTLKIIDKDRD